MNYEFLFEGEFNYEFVCAQTVRLDNMLYSRTDSTEAGRNIYKDEFKNNSLYRKGTIDYPWLRYWAVGQTYLIPKDIVLSSAVCPVKAVRLEGAGEVENPARAKDWKKCAKKCFDNKECKYWEYDDKTKKCKLRKDFDKLVEKPGSPQIRIGTRDCPGISTNYVEGLCPENDRSKSMWKRGNGM